MRMMPCCLLLVVLGIGGRFALGARGTVDGSDPGFWESHVVVVVRAAREGIDLEGPVVSVLCGTIPVPRAMKVIGAGRTEGFKTGQEFAVCVGQNHGEWELLLGRISVPTFMPQNVARYEITGPDDRQLLLLRERLAMLQPKRQEVLLQLAGKERDAELQARLGAYNTYWKNHALLLAHVTGGESEGTVRAEVQSVLFAPEGSPAVDKPPVLAGATAVLAEAAKGGGWTVVLVVDTGKGWAIDGGGSGAEFMPDGSGVAVVKDEKDGKIAEIEKSVQGWEKKIWEGGAGTNKGGPDK
jgi:hypothetical protein